MSKANNPKQTDKATTGYVHSVETAGTVDGPGMRFIVFLSGCPLSCAYCHNPDCMKMKQGGEPHDSAPLIEEIKSYKNFMTRTGGGVTISGGEPLVQPEFTETLLRGCKEAGLHTALDTTGYLKAPDSLLDLVDLVLLDIKSGLPEIYKNVTGVELSPTLKFAQHLKEIGKPVWIRFVLVPGLTDSEENLHAVAKIIADLDNVERTEILPFHKMGEHKWEALGLQYRLKDTNPPTNEQVDHAKAIFESYGLHVKT